MYLQQYATLQEGVDWLRAQDNVDANRIAVVGICVGGSIALLAGIYLKHVRALPVLYIFTFTATAICM